MSLHNLGVGGQCRITVIKQTDEKSTIYTPDSCKRKTQQKFKQFLEALNMKEEAYSKKKKKQQRKIQFCFTNSFEIKEHETDKDGRFVIGSG